MFNFKYENKLYFLDDVLDELEKDGYDREMVKETYNFFLNQLKKDISTTDSVAYSLGTLGKLYYSAYGVNSLKHKSKGQIKHKEAKGGDATKEKKYLEIMEKKHDRIENMLQTLKEKGVKKNLLYRRRFNFQSIKNQ